MTRTLTLSLLTLFILTATTEARAGTIYLETIPASVDAGSTDNILNVMVDLSADDISLGGIIGYDFEFVFESDIDFEIQPGGTFQSVTFENLLSSTDQGPVLGPPLASNGYSALGRRRLPATSVAETLSSPKAYGLASFKFNVDPLALGGDVFPTFVTGEIFFEGPSLILDGSSPGGITIMGASSSGPGGTVPEPASLVVWSILGLAGVARARRRKGKLAVA